jgi:tellurite methyltransferase
MQMANGGYDDGYRTCPCLWGKEPGSYVKLLLSRMKSFDGLHFLDAGCGEGKNAAFIAANGGSVEALEISDLAQENGLKAWGSNSLITWRSGDIRQSELTTEAYDVVVAYGLLHCLSTEAEIAQVLNNLKRATRVGGYNVVCAFNRRHQELEAHPGFSPMLLAHDDYIGAYAKHWEIIASSDSDLVETHPHNGIQHTHSMTRLLVRKGSR